jgi:hypothetical protein
LRLAAARNHCALSFAKSRRDISADLDVVAKGSIVTEAGESRYWIASVAFPEERRAHLRRSFLRLEVDGRDSVAIAVSGRPFEVVHRAPVEIALHRHTFGRRELHSGPVRADEHDPMVSQTWPSLKITSSAAQPLLT